MATRMTINGVSARTEAGTEKYECFQLGIGRRRRTFAQYGYRHTGEELPAYIRTTLDEYQTVRDKRLDVKQGEEGSR